ncbi:MAG: nucleotidyltransferase domain-containing protein [Thermodesulfobacteriota bacterium]
MTSRNRPILEKSRLPVSILDFDRNELMELLREKLSAHHNVRSAFFFGSAATGTEDFWSDIDLVIVADTDEAFIERPRQFFDLLDIGVPMDILVYTPEEYDELIRSTSGFWKSFQQSKLAIL